MSSLRKIEANRANALKSTGPRTAAGKFYSSQNAVTHGITARTLCIRTDNPEELNSLIAGYMRRFQPVDQPETDLVAAMISAAWRMRRSWRQESAILDAQLSEDATAVDKKYVSIDSDSRGGLAFRNSSDKSPFTWQNLDRQESRLRRLWSTAYSDLMLLRSARASCQNEAKNSSDLNAA